MNTNVMEPTCFRGQICISCDVQPVDADNEAQTQIINISDAQNDANMNINDAEYMMQCDIYEATNVIPGRYRVKVQCGSQFS